MSRVRFLALVALWAAAAMACNLPAAGVTPAPTGIGRVTPAAGSPAAMPTVQPLAPTETPPAGPGPGGCTLVAQYMADLTIPDNSTISPGAGFLKTWRVKNNGTCEWGAGYQLVFAEGNPMGGPPAVDVSRTRPGGTLDISVGLQAPTAPGVHTGRWRFRASNGTIFGGLTVVIVVPATATATVAPPTATSTTRPTASAIITPTAGGGGSGPWNGRWATLCGAGQCGTMDLVQTGNIVTGRFAIDTSTPGTINATVSGDRLSGAWSRGGSGGTLDWWLGGTNLRWRGNLDGTSPWCGSRPGETLPSPCGVGTFQGEWTISCPACFGTMQIAQNGANFTGSYSLGAITGTISGTVAAGTYRGTSPSGGGSSASGTFAWYLLNRNQFSGNANGASEWCGYRSGSSVPSPCLRP